MGIRNVTTLIAADAEIGSADSIRVAKGEAVTMVAADLGEGEYFEVEINADGSWEPMHINDDPNPFRLTKTWNVRSIPFPGNYQVIKKFAGASKLVLHR